MGDERFTVRRRRVPGAPGVPGVAGTAYEDFEVREGAEWRARLRTRPWAEHVARLLNEHGGPA